MVRCNKSKNKKLRTVYHPIHDYWTCVLGFPSMPYHLASGAPATGKTPYRYGNGLVPVRPPHAWTILAWGCLRTGPVCSARDKETPYCHGLVSSLLPHAWRGTWPTESRRAGRIWWESESIPQDESGQAGFAHPRPPSLGMGRPLDKMIFAGP